MIGGGISNSKPKKKKKKKKSNKNIVNKTALAGPGENELDLSSNFADPNGEHQKGRIIRNI